MLICVRGNLWKESGLVQFSPTSQLEATTVPQNSIPSALLGAEEARNTAALWVISEMELDTSRAPCSQELPLGAQVGPECVK